MAGSISEKYPWHRCKTGEGFFVPALDPWPVIREGLKAANDFYGPRNNCKARFGICKGFLGVYFTRAAL